MTQSMSKAGYPYDNAPMERYFNTLKNECINLYEFQTEDALYQALGWQDKQDSPNRQGITIQHFLNHKCYKNA